MKRKPKPIHQQARDKKLPPGDARELELFRTFLRDPSGNRQLAYERIYGDKK